MEQVIEDALTGGYGAIEMEPTGDPKRPLCWPVDGHRSGSMPVGMERKIRRATRRRFQANWNRVP